MREREVSDRLPCSKMTQSEVDVSTLSMEAQLKETQRELDELKSQFLNSRLHRESEGDSLIAAARISKIPPFSRKNPILWFVLVEVSLRRSNVPLESTKLDYVIMCGIG